MKSKFFILLIIFLLGGNKIFSQPFVDVVNASYQTFSTSYKDSSKWKNSTDNYFLNFFLPKQFKNGNTLLIRLNSEMLNSHIFSDSSYSASLSSISMPLGFKFVSTNKKWETIIIGIPKLASDFKLKINSHDVQYGGIFLEQFVASDKLKIKAGLYYNREAFGDFFVPLVAVDWKATDRIYFYGILPTNYKVEFNIVKEKLYAGLNFKSFTRSFSLSQKNNFDYVRYDEMQLKLFVDCFVYHKLLMFAEIGYSIGKNPWQYKFNTKDVTYVNPIYTPTESYPIFNVGLAYRIRLDFDKKE